MTTPTAIDNVDISANDVVDGTQSSVGVGDKDATIQKQPKGLGTLESVPVMQAVVSNKTSTFDFFNFTYMTNVPCFIYTYRNLLKLSDIRKRLGHDKPVLQIPNHMEPCLQHQHYKQYVFQHVSCYSFV